MLALSLARKCLGIIFSSDLQNITHEWHAKFYLSPETIADKCKCNSIGNYNYNLHASYNIRVTYSLILYTLILCKCKVLDKICKLLHIINVKTF
jgi:hypothetical protein